MGVLGYSEEIEPLGTWGAVRQAALSEPHFLVLNGDSRREHDLRELIHFHMSTGALATIAEVVDAARFGSIDVEPKGVIMAFVEKSCGSPSTLVNGVGYAFSRRVLTVAPAGSSLLEKEVFPVRLSRGAYAMLVHGFFVDIGIPTDDQRLQDNPRGWIARMRLRSGDLAC